VLGHKEPQHFFLAEGTNTQRSYNRTVNASRYPYDSTTTAQLAENLLAQRAGNTVHFCGRVQLEHIFVEHEYLISGNAVNFVSG
jgi:hypothetical protein